MHHDSTPPPPDEQDARPLEPGLSYPDAVLAEHDWSRLDAALVHLLEDVWRRRQQAERRVLEAAEQAIEGDQ